MKSYSPEPLTPEEREMARLTGHLGLQGEPSAAVDARILAAANAALERQQPARRKPRWPVALGLAASVIFAVGIAWQLRPLQTPMAMDASEAPAVTATATTEQEAVADNAAAVASAPLSQTKLTGTPRAEAPAAAEPAQVEQAPSAPARVMTPPPESRAPPRQLDRPSAKTLESRRQAPIAGNVGAGYSPPAPPAPPAPAAVIAAAPVPAAEASIPFATDPLEAYSAYPAADSSAAASIGAVAAKPPAEALAEAKATRAAGSARYKESASLERVEVTGSRMKRTDLQVPVSDDARLSVTEWLERVRTRYGLGDAGAAKQSLLLFVKDHPSEPVPDDLEPLLEK